MTTTSSATAESTGSSGSTASQGAPHVNDVHVIGRVSSVGQERTLPSGDTVCSVRVVVRRPEGHPSRQRVDVFDCSAWGEPVRSRMMTWCEGDTVEVTGSVRRRFFRHGGVAASRVEIEVSSGEVIHPAESG